MNTQPNDGGPAFPGEQGHCPDGTWNQTFYPGMSLRDYFAAAALQGIIASFAGVSIKQAAKFASVSGRPFDDIASESAFRYADAMLAARGKEDE